MALMASAEVSAFFHPHPEPRQTVPPAQIIPGCLFISGKDVAHDPAWLEQHNITHILSCSDDGDGEPTATGIAHLSVKLSDHAGDGDQIREVLPSCFSFFQNAVEAGGVVLVHCAVGVSRSPAVVTAWLMHHEKLTLRDAFQRVRQEHAPAYPNLGLWFALSDFEMESQGTNSIPMEAFELHAEVDVVEEEVEDGAEFISDDDY